MHDLFEFALDGVWATAVGGLLGLACIVVVWLLATIPDRMSCQSKANLMGLRSQYGVISGCMIEYKPGKWIDINNYKVIKDKD